MSRLLAVLIALCMLACGQAVQAAPDAGMHIVLPDAGEPPDASGAIDAGLEDAPDASGPADPFAAVRDDYARIDAVGCLCRFAELGFATADACNASIGWSSAAYACDHMGYDAATAALRDYYVCADEMLSAQASCLEAASCDEAAIAACPVGFTCLFGSPDASAAYYAVRDPCVRETIVGPPDACAAGDVVTNAGSAVLHGTTMLAGDDAMGSCGGAGAADRGHFFRATSAGTYTFDTRGSSFDTVLYVLSACGGTELACNDEDTLAPHPFAHTSRVEVTLAADQEVVVIVDGYDSESAGAYVVDVSIAP